MKLLVFDNVFRQHCLLSIKLLFSFLHFFCTAAPCYHPVVLPPNSIFVNEQRPKILQFGMKATVTCKTGFVKVAGGEEVRCGLNGQFNWTFGRLSCRPVTCPDLQTWQFSGIRESPKGDVFAISSNLSFSCQEGFELVGEASLTCQSDGNWSSAVPVCKCKLKV